MPGLGYSTQNLQLQHVKSSFPGQGLNPGPLHWDTESLATGPPGSPCIKKYIYLFIFGCAASLAVMHLVLHLVLHLQRGLFFGCGEQGLLSSGGLLIAVASLVAEHRL